MTPEELKYQEELKAGGVELPELNADELKAKEEADAKAKADADAKAQADKEKADADAKAAAEAGEEGDDNKGKKRSIYDDLKDKKQDLKAEREARLVAETERDTFAKELETLKAAGGNKKDIEKAEESIEAFAEANKLDPEALKTMRDLFLKDFKAPQSLSDEDRKTLEEAKTFSSENRKIAEKHQFDTEFQATVPAIKELFPQATAEEVAEVGKKLESLAHSKEWHDKELDYIVFKNKELLSKLISPKTRGMESKGNKDTQDAPANFDPNADYSKMTMKEREVWEEGYRKMTKNEGLAEDSQGRKILI